MTRYALKKYLLSHIYSLPIFRQKKIVNLLVLFLASFFLVINYFITPGRLVQGVDALMWVTHTKYYRDFNWIYPWYDKASLGFVRTPSLLNILFGSSDTIIKEPSWVYRIAILTIILMASLGTYEYIKHLTNDSTASVIGALSYILNPWILNEIGNGHIDILAGAGLFPLFLLAFEKRKIVLASILACAFLTAANPEAIYAFGIFFIAYIFVKFDLNRKKQNITYLLTVTVLSVGLSMFYIVPFIWVNGLSGYSGLKPWTIEDISDFIMPLWLAILCLASVSLVAILVLKYGRKYKYVNFYCVAAVLTTLLAASPTFPVLDKLYIWMFTNVPFFSIFRVPIRLMIVTIFCVAYMIGILSARSKNSTGEVKIPFKKRKIPKGQIYRTIISSAFILTFIISAFLVPFSMPGNYTPDPSWISNYEWLSSQSENHWNVYTLPVTAGWIMTPYGATQDYGTLSTLFSDRSVIGVPAKTTTSYAFLMYLEYLVKNNVTDQWLKLLGATNVKYVTCEPNMNNQEAFLIHQEGIGNDMLVYAYRDAKVYENPYWVPMFRVVSDVNLLAGGYNTVLSLLRHSFNFSNSDLYFLRPEENDCTVNYSSIIYEDFMDYLMLKLSAGIKISAYKFGVDYTRDPEKDWIKEDSWKIEGETVFNDFTLSISGEHTRTIQFDAKEKGMYEIFARILAGPASDRGNLTIVNTTIQPSWCSYSFRWYNFGEINIAKGQNVLKIGNSGKRNDIDGIILVKQDDFENCSENAIRELQNSTKSIIFTDRAYNIFNVTTDTNWKIDEVQFDCDGNVLHSANGGELSFKLVVGNTQLVGQGVTLPRSGNYTILLRANTYGNMLLQIDNETLVSGGCGEYSIYKYSLPPLNEGVHDVRLRFNRTTYLDDIVIYSASKHEDSLEKVFQGEKNNSTISVDKVNPTEYILNVKDNTNESYLMVSCSYDSRWKAYVNNVEFSPIRINDVFLGFALNKTGDFQIRVVFTGQTYVILGYSITLTSLSVILIVSLVKYAKTKKLRKESNANRSVLAFF